MAQYRASGGLELFKYSARQEQRRSGAASQKLRRKQGAAEVLEVVKSYARQELLDPLRGVPRWLALGLLGSIGVIIGVVLLVLALLRGLQTETGAAFEGNLSWVPYAIALVAMLLLATAMGMLVNRRSLS